MKQPFFFEGFCDVRIILKSLLLFSIFFLFCRSFVCYGEETPAKKIADFKMNSETIETKIKSQIEARIKAETEIKSQTKAKAEAEIKSQTKTKAEAESENNKKMDALFTQLETLLPQENGNWSVYVCDLANETESSINDKSMQAASLIKLYIMGAVYENYEALSKQYGQENLDSNLSSMITVSDNTAANTLVSYLGAGDSTLGMSVVNSFCLDHDFTASHMGRILLQNNEFGDNYTSVSDCGHFLKSIYQKDTEEFPYADSMFSLLSKQTRTNKIPAQMPEGVHVANKTGELSNVENDAGIVYDTKNDLIIVFMSEYVSSASSAQSSIASISRQIYDYYNGQ